MYSSFHTFSNYASGGCAGSILPEFHTPDSVSNHPATGHSNQKHCRNFYK